jgi:alpha-L-rhamnosidase
MEMRTNHQSGLNSYTSLTSVPQEIKHINTQQNYKMSADIRVVALRTNNRSRPLGVDTVRPEFAWKLSTDSQSVAQKAYSIQVSTHPDLSQNLVWATGKVTSIEQFGIQYAGKQLASRCRYYWRVCVSTSEDGELGNWSPAEWFETAILDESLWTARWISSVLPAGKVDNKPIYLRGTLNVSVPVVDGRAYVSALGWYHLIINGNDLTGSALVPRWTPYDDIVEYQTYDIAKYCRVGENVVFLIIADGRFRGHLGLLDHRAVYGDRLAGILQMHLKLEDGDDVTFITDEQWSCGGGHILAADPKGGEKVDLRIYNNEMYTSIRPQLDFEPAHFIPQHGRKLIAEEVAPVREVMRLQPKKFMVTPSGKKIIDFGQNFTGTIRIRLSGASGSRVVLTYSEVMIADGELDKKYLQTLGRGILQKDEVILSGQSQWYQSWFTFRGFRYVELDGVRVNIEPSDIEGVVLSSDLDRVGSFECSDAMVNQLYQNVVWSMRSNFLDTPTDCPTRERTGWTGDIQIFSPTATTVMDVQAYLRRYLRNLRYEQNDDGRVPCYIPREQSQFSGGSGKFAKCFWSSTGWGDVSVMLPWTLYQKYDDTAILEAQYDSMQRWVGYLERLARESNGWSRWLSPSIGHLEHYILSTGFHWGEWLRPGETNPWSIVYGLMKGGAVVPTAYYAQSTRILAKTAKILGRESDATRYEELGSKIVEAWRAAFVYKDGRIGDDKQDDYVRAIAFELIPPDKYPACIERLVKLIEKADYHLGTGFLSTAMLLPVLAANGRADVAFRLLKQDSVPSWGAQIKQDATTTWEAWDGYDDKGNAKMSHNHYSLGAVAGWMQTGIAGLSAAEPGFRRIKIQPVIGGGLTYASTSLETPLGLASSEWKFQDGRVMLKVVVPPCAMADVHLGNESVESVSCGTYDFEWVHK